MLKSQTNPFLPEDYHSKNNPTPCLNKARVLTLQDFAGSSIEEMEPHFVNPNYPTNVSKFNSTKVNETNNSDFLSSKQNTTIFESYDTQTLINKGLLKLGALGNKEHLNQAVNYFSQALEQDTSNLEALYYINLAYRDLTDYQSALNSAEKIIKVYPDSPVGIFSKASTLEEMSLIEESKALYSKMLTYNSLSFSSYLDFHVMGSYYYYSLDDKLEAEKFYLNALNINKKSAFTLIGLSSIYLNNEKFHQSLKYALNGLDILPNDTALLSHAANSSRQLGFEALKNENSDEAQNYLQEAVKYYEKAHDNGAEFDLNFLSSCTNAYRDLKDYDHAVEWCDKYLELHTKDPVALSIKGQIYFTQAYKLPENDPYFKSIQMKAIAAYDKAYFEYKQDSKYKDTLDKIWKDYIKEGFLYREDLRNQNTVFVHQVKHAMNTNDENVLLAKKLAFLDKPENAALKEYYETFQQVIDIYFVSALVGTSGKFQKEKPSAFTVVEKLSKVADSLPGASFVIGAVLKVAETGHGIYDDNKDKYILSNLGNLDKVKSIAQDVALELAIVKRDAINNPAEAEDAFMSNLLSKLSKLKDKIKVNLKDTPAKVLAYKDAGLMIRECQKEKIIVPKGSTINDKFISDIQEADALLNLKASIKKANKAIDEINSKGKSCIVMALTDIEYDNPVAKSVLNNPGLVKILGKDLFNFIDMFDNKSTEADQVKSFTNVVTIETGLSNLLDVSGELV